MKKFVLGSGSQGRKDILKYLGFVPDHVLVPDIDETAVAKEKGIDLAKRLAIQKGINLQ